VSAAYDIPRRPGEPPRSFVEATERPPSIHGYTDGPAQREAFIRAGIITPPEVVRARGVPPPFVHTQRWHDDDCDGRRAVARKAQQTMSSCLPTCRIGAPLATCKLLGSEDWRRNVRPELEGPP
jgi:hypothetical protein